MDGSNYLSAALSKPMGIVFEENDAEFGGIFVHSIKEDGAAAHDGSVQEGDQLVAVNTQKVSGMSFDDALGAIIDAEGGLVRLTFFRGSAQQLYGPTGASQAWLDEFIGDGAVAKEEAKTAE
jgi:PDZ domain